MTDSDLVAKVWMREPKDQVEFWVGGSGFGFSELGGGDLGESGGVGSSAKTALKKFIGNFFFCFWGKNYRFDLMIYVKAVWSGRSLAYTHL